MKDKNTKSQINSKERVREFGEVYTSAKEVNDMLSCIGKHILKLDLTIMEPACGEGAFLERILICRLDEINKSRKNKLLFQKKTFQSLSSLYGIDILQDNVLKCRESLESLALENFNKYYDIDENLLKSIKYILEKNIVHADAITMKLVPSNEGIKFSEWKFINNTTIKRKEYSYSDVIDGRSLNELPLFSESNEEVFIPRAIKEYEPKHFMDLTYE
jgi:hypothetical protein